MKFDAGPPWAAIFQLFDELVELDPAQRTERLDAIRAADPALHAGIEQLLAADTAADVRLARIDRALITSDVRDAHQREPDPLRLVGRTISHFRIMTPIAHGGMGVVYRAEDTQLQRAIALKVPLPVHLCDQGMRARFLREARAAGSLDHPNLCTIYEAGETDDGHAFIAMPLYTGETLRDRLVRGGALPVAEAFAIAQQIARGLAVAHAAGLVHRDLKPGNVMVLRDGMVKILDFGLAHTSDVSLTTSRALLGTATYMAPEQIQGRAVDRRTDLWALGVVLYEMLAGRRPFEGEHAVAIAHAIVHEQPIAVTALRRDVTAALQGIVQRLLCKDPALRYQQASDVVADLSALEFGAGPFLRARSPSVLTAKRKAYTTAGIALGVLLVAGAGVRLLRQDVTAVPGAVTLAVLPFENHGGDDYRHIALALSNEIGLRLSRLNAFTILGHNTAAQQVGKPKPVRQIARELSAAGVVTGTVHAHGEQVVIEVMLHNVGSSKPQWSMQYQRSASDLRDVVAHAAASIVSAWQLRPNDAEKELLERLPAADARAYELYLRGRGAELAALPPRGNDALPVADIRLAQSFYSRAREIEPGFALARARLAQLHMRSAIAYDTTFARREQARLEAEAALRLHPALPEAHEALATYWRRNGELPRAVDELYRALAAAPRSADLHFALGRLFAAMGRLDEALADLDRAIQLDPGNAERAFVFAVYALRARRDTVAMRAFDRAIALAPDYHMFKVIRGHTWLRAFGIPDTLEAVMRSIPPDWDPDGMATWARYSVLRVQRRYRDALAMLDASRSQLSRDGLVYHPTSLIRAEVYAALGDRARARTHFEAARVLLADSVAARPNDPSIRVSLALAHAGLGRRADAARKARRALELAPLSLGNAQATAHMGGVVEVFGRIGELDAAFQLVELLLAMPAGREITVPWLRVSPTFDPLRADPRLEQLIARFSTS